MSGKTDIPTQHLSRFILKGKTYTFRANAPPDRVCSDFVSFVSIEPGFFNAFNQCFILRKS